jgi:hypothetical protein
MKVQSIASLAFCAVFFYAMPAAHAGRIVIPVFQNQSGVNNGTQNQTGSAGSSQTGVLDQSNQQSQTVNVIVPDNFRGSVRTIYIGGGDGSGNFRRNAPQRRWETDRFQPHPR